MQSERHRDLQSLQSERSLQPDQSNQLLIEELHLDKCSISQLRSIASQVHAPSTRKKTDLIRNIQEAQMNQAIRHGNLERVKTLFQSVECGFYQIEEAARHKYPEIVKYFFQMGVECSPQVMDLFAFDGNLEMVMYLHQNGKDCTENAMNWATTRGHVEVVKYLHSIGFPISQDVDYAMGEGSPKMIKYFYQHGYSPSQAAVGSAVKWGHLDAIKCLHELGYKFNDLLMDLAVFTFNIEMVKFFHSNGMKCTDPDIANKIFKFTDERVLPMLRYLFSIGVPMNTEILNYLAEHSQSETEREMYLNVVPK